MYEHPYYFKFTRAQNGHAKLWYLETLLPNSHFEGPWYMFQVGKYTVHLSKDDVMCKPTDLWEDMGMEFQHIPKTIVFAHPSPIWNHSLSAILGWNHIGKCCEWICFRDYTEQACIRQNQSKILGVCFQFTSHAAANIHCSLRFLCFQS